VREYNRAVASDRLAEPDPVDSGDERLKLRTTNLQRHSAPILALKLQKVERDQRRLSRAPIASQRRKVAVPIRAELAMIEQELSARTRPAPGYSVPNSRVGEAVRAVVKSHPAVRRLVEDFATARRAFQQSEATLIHLSAQRCVPDDLVSLAPRADATRFADPDPAWVSAIAALGVDADAELPE
jgi:hypothetical protein